MKSVADIMTTHLVTLKADDNLHQARMLLKQHNIRHLPVLDENNRFAGVLTQRDLLNNALKVVESYGFSKLAAREQRSSVADFMDARCQTMSSDTVLADAAEFFLAHKHKCLPIVDDGRLKGLVTSVDFVKLSLYLLKNA